ncbi:MAG TPA: YceI family protein [Bacteroidota bacterium]|jgi:polyisoprenoid-binding protein YceI|nr:YceI family protein [Bacteroidota bacterium]
MNKFMTIIAGMLLVATAAFSQATWNLDNAHSSVKFSVSHLIISEVEGNFRSFTGSLRSDKSDFSDAQVTFAVDVASINTENEGRDKHLTTDDFFNAEKYPKMSFKSVSWKKVDEHNFALEGDLTIRDVTKRVTFAVKNGGTIQDPWGNTKSGFKAIATINRFDYGLKFNALTEAGSAVVGKDVTITLNLEFAKQKSS